MLTRFHQQYKKVYFIGIGGISMSGLAEILIRQGFAVTGSDLHKTDITNRLESLGIQIQYAHQKENITDDIDLVVYTAAIQKDNPELLEAKTKKITIMERAALLGEIMRHYPYSIAVSGTHGKTTTTSMVSQILLEAEKDPTVSVGGLLDSIDGNIRCGNSGFFVAEACEYFNSFLHFNPFVGIILNIEEDHMDFFDNINTIRQSFKQFGQNIPKEGALVINKNIPELDSLLMDMKCNFYTYGDSDADCLAANIEYDKFARGRFDIIFKGNVMGNVSLKVPGEHNISNALAAFCAAMHFDIPIQTIIEGLRNFAGAKRRFEIKGHYRDVSIIDDYAHHPTEIKATLKAAKKVKHNRLICVFQPHTYTRTKAFLNEFAKSFQDADIVIITDIYAAREKDLGIIHASNIVEKMQEQKQEVYYKKSFDDIKKFLLKNFLSGDLLITMGAGDVYTIGVDILKEDLSTLSTQLVPIDKKASCE